MVQPTPSFKLLGPFRARAVFVVAVALLLLPMLAAFTLTPNVAAQEVPELQVNSNRYVVTDSETGEIYAQRNSDQHVAIGSLTKIFNVIEALEIAPLDTVITTDESDMKDPANNSLMGFDPGEELTLKELLYGMMLPSGNDAAHAVARSLGYQEGDTDPQQSVDRYMGWINQRVLDMGLKDTHLITPDGWGVPGHYTTAHDLAAFTRYAMRYPFFKTLISTAQYTTAAGNTITNNNRLLGLYPDLVGGKTGYDWDAGWCLVEVAERDGMQMVSVTLDGIHDDMDWYDDNEVLLDYGFDQRSAQKKASTAWAGSSALFTDPDVAVLDRSAAATGLLGGQPAGLAAGTTGTTDTTGNPAAGTDPNQGADGATTGQTAVNDTRNDVAAAPVATTETGNADSSGSSLGATVARVLLAIGLVGLVILAAAFLYTRRKPRRPLGAVTGTRSPNRSASLRPADRPTSSAARSAQRRLQSPRH